MKITNCFSSSASCRNFFAFDLSQEKCSHIPRGYGSFRVIFLIPPRYAFFSTTCLHFTFVSGSSPSVVVVVVAVAVAAVVAVIVSDADESVCIFTHLAHARSYELMKSVQTWRRGPAQNQGVTPPQS